MAKKKPENRRETGRKANGQFAKGVSGNPGGRPQDTLTPHLREIAATGKGKQVAERLFAEALAGNVQAIGILLDRLDGKPKQGIDLSVEQRKNEMLENAVAELMRTHGVTREEALETMLAVMPEAKEWVH